MFEVKFKVKILGVKATVREPPQRQLFVFVQSARPYDIFCPCCVDVLCVLEYCYIVWQATTSGKDK